MTMISSTKFIHECKKRGLGLNTHFLDYLTEEKIIEPLHIEGGRNFFDSFQVLVIAEVSRLSKIIGDIRENTGDFVKYTKYIRDFLPVLYELRHMYADKVYGYKSSGFFSIFDKETDVKNIAHHFKLKRKKLEEIRNRFYSRGNSIDPMGNWYIFLKNIRIREPQKFQTIKGSVLLAHDYYVASELITLFYKDYFSNKILEPEDMTDGRAGKWKYAECQKCCKKLKMSDFGEKYCFGCKGEISKSIEGGWKCVCGESILMKFSDGSETLNNLFLGKNVKRKMSQYIRLEYGKMIMQVTCNKCGKTNQKMIENGWI